MNKGEYMIGIILMSHGKMAEGMLDTIYMFFGVNVSQIRALVFEGSDAPEEFDVKLQKAIKEVDDGHGVIGFCDLMGGTPANRSILQMSNRFQVIAGMNFPILIELLGIRSSGIDISELNIQELLEIGKKGVISINECFANFNQ